MPDNRNPAAARTRRKLEAATTAPLNVAPPPDKAAARERVLAVLFRLALEGNVSAAKLYLDCGGADDDGSLTAEDVLKLLQDHLAPAPQ